MRALRQKEQTRYTTRRHPNSQRVRSVRGKLRQSPNAIHQEQLLEQRPSLRDSQCPEERKGHVPTPPKKSEL